MDYHQPGFLPIVEEKHFTVIVTVQQISDDRWLATIDNGWWLAYGNTRNQAIKNVEKRYRDELY